MRPHRFDVVSFVFGVLFLTVAAMAATGSFDISGDLLTWIGAGALLLIGVVLLFGSRSGERRASLPEHMDED